MMLMLTDDQVIEIFESPDAPPTSIETIPSAAGKVNIRPNT
jgi:hypothetical protein